MLAYLSMLMAQRLSMLAVHSKTSIDIHSSHKTQPKGHDPKPQNNQNVEKTWTMREQFDKIDNVLCLISSLIENDKSLNT